MKNILLNQKLGRQFKNTLDKADNYSQILFNKTFMEGYKFQKEYIVKRIAREDYYHN